MIIIGGFQSLKENLGIGIDAHDEFIQSLISSPDIRWTHLFIFIFPVEFQFQLQRGDVWNQNSTIINS